MLKSGDFKTNYIWDAYGLFTPFKINFSMVIPSILMFPLLNEFVPSISDPSTQESTQLIFFTKKKLNVWTFVSRSN